MRDEWRRRWLYAAAVGGGLLLAGVLAVIFTPAIRVLVRWISGSDWKGMSGADRAAAFGQFRMALVQVVAVLGASVALLFTAFNYRLSRRGQVTDRFTKALERLGSDQMYVRIGGVLALEQIVQDAPDQAMHAAQILQAFIRERAPRRPTPKVAAVRRTVNAARRAARTNNSVRTPAQPLPKSPAADVQAALTALTQPISRAHVSSAVQVDLSGLHLVGADLRGADLTESDLRQTDLSGARLRGAKLTKALLWRADLSKAWMSEATFTGAWLREADLAGALLQDADLTDTKLGEANLANADLRKAVLSNSDLMDTHLTEGGGGLANLAGADLRGTDLLSASVAVEQVISARPARDTVLPPALAADARVIARINQPGALGEKSGQGATSTA